ncbi:hypothetical protein [Aquimarina algicola]|uniref:Viral A-type inclusion protein n=1 Tax=Aquimarina algicola TaxID=2589995 RepID=A0A504J9F9_9FLAO|nr:hypothetical protein [Aquimarina algicola]TPN85225.1 hypothetical protein FHK87_14445 [Aquimarina algicola]
MKTLFRTFIFVFAAIATLSCNQLSKEEQEFDALMQKVIDVHDEVMPKMGEISSLIKELKPKIDTTAQGQEYAQAQQKLKDSYDFMMTWMSDFSETFPHEEEETKVDTEKLATQMKLLKEEEVKVNKLKNQINSSIAEAKKILGKTE